MEKNTSKSSGGLGLKRSRCYSDFSKLIDESSELNNDSSLCYNNCKNNICFFGCINKQYCSDKCVNYLYSNKKQQISKTKSINAVSCLSYISPNNCTSYEYYSQFHLQSPSNDKIIKNIYHKINESLNNLTISKSARFEAINSFLLEKCTVPSKDLSLTEIGNIYDQEIHI